MKRLTRRTWLAVLVVAVAVLATACAPRPFATSSPWNTPLGGVGWRDDPNLRNGHSWVNNEQFSVPVVRSGGFDPVVTVSVPPSWGWPGGVVNVRIPAGVGGAAGSDRSLVILDAGVVYDFWQFHRSGLHSGSASAWAASFVTGSGWGRANPFLGAGIRASGSSSLGGLIVGDDLAGDDYRHALAVSVLGSALSAGVVAPAIAGEGGSGSIPMGGRIGIPAGTPMPGGLSSMGVRMWNTLTRYGAYVVDMHGGSAPVIFYADPRSVGNDKVGPLRNPGGDLDRIMPYVRVVK